MCISKETGTQQWSTCMDFLIQWGKAYHCPYACTKDLHEPGSAFLVTLYILMSESVINLIG